MLVLLASPAHAQDAIAAYDEMHTLAQKNAWAGVERVYDESFARPGVDMPARVLELAAQAAKYQGKTGEYRMRLAALQTMSPTNERAHVLDVIDAHYGWVDIEGTFRIPSTVDVPMPFSRDDRKSIEWAQKVLAETGSFTGMLPVDSEYKVTGACTLSFTPTPSGRVTLDVHNGRRWQAACGEPAPWWNVLALNG